MIFNVTGGGASFQNLLVVVANTGSTVSITLGGTTKTVAERNGSWCFANIQAGDYTVSAVLDGETKTETVTVAETGVTYFAFVYNIVPVLNGSYPADKSVACQESVTSEVRIATAGIPATYTYQWYVNDSAVSGATESSYTFTPTALGTTSVYCLVTNEAGTVQSRTATITATSTIPEFTYTGSYKIVDDNDNAISSSTGNWKIKFLTSGTLKFTKIPGGGVIDVFLVGGGGGGSNTTNSPGDYGNSSNGGGGGYTTTAKSISINTETSYAIVVGAGGGAGANGGSSSGFGKTASGGNKGATTSGSGSGGSGGGGGAWTSAAGAGGSNGSAGGNGFIKGGTGQGTTTREFGESSGTLYSGGGGGGGTCTGSNAGAGGSGGGGAGASSSSQTASAGSGTANTGGGGGGGNSHYHAYNPPFCERHRWGYETTFDRLPLLIFFCYNPLAGCWHTTEPEEVSGGAV